jgi:hypothetical protein
MNNVENEDTTNNKNNNFPYKPNNRINTTIKTNNNGKKNNSVKLSVAVYLKWCVYKNNHVIFVILNNQL